MDMCRRSPARSCSWVILATHAGLTGPHRKPVTTLVYPARLLCHPGRLATGTAGMPAGARC